MSPGLWYEEIFRRFFDKKIGENGIILAALTMAASEAMFFNFGAGNELRQKAAFNFRKTRFDEIQGDVCAQYQIFQEWVSLAKKISDGTLDLESSGIDSATDVDEAAQKAAENIRNLSGNETENVGSADEDQYSDEDYSDPEDQDQDEIGEKENLDLLDVS